VQAGVTTSRLNDLLDGYIRDHGAIPACLGYKGFPAATCISLNNVVCHGIPGDTVLKPGDILNIDVTTILGGYYGDTSSMFHIPPIPDNTHRLLNVTKQCLDIGIRQVRPDNWFGNIGYWINQHATSHKFSVVWKFCGHGVGLHFHESPQISHIADRYTGEQMKPGMIFTIEPMINEKGPECLVSEVDGWTATTLDGGLSAQYEHTVLVTERGSEILTLPL
jgi:methionyl aminopeptidase